MFDQQPVVPLFALPAPEVHEHPTALRLACQREFELTFAQGLVAIAVTLGHSEATVPEQDRAAAVLALGDGPFEIAVVLRVILHLHREPLAGRVEDGPFVTAQDLKTPSCSGRKL